MLAQHAEATERAFTQQARTFEDPRLNAVLTTESAWVFERLPRGPRDVVLDVAAGTGLAGRGLAGEVAAVVALDATPAMLAAGQRAAEEAAIRNIVFMRGSAERLPFLGDAFSIVLCRYALHHFAEPRRPLAEMARCLRPWGRLAIADIVVGEHPGAARATNEIERLRDPSHVRAVSASELQGLLVSAGLEAHYAETREVRRPLEPWLDGAETPPPAREEIRRRMLDELAGGASTGLDPAQADDGTLTFVHTIASVFALKPGP